MGVQGLADGFLAGFQTMDNYYRGQKADARAEKELGLRQRSKVEGKLAADRQKRQCGNCAVQNNSSGKQNTIHPSGNSLDENRIARPACSGKEGKQIAYRAELQYQRTVKHH